MTLTMRLAILSSLALAGCSLGAGSAYVGQWRPRTQVDFEACLIDETGGCQDTKQVASEIPGRRFWGVILGFPALGASSVEQGGTTTTMMRAEISAEYLRGWGRWAWGVRASVLFEGAAGDDPDRVHGVSMVPVTGVGYLSLTERISIRAGLGASPYTQTEGEYSLIAGRGLVGMQYALSRTHSENHIVLSLDLDTLYVPFDETYRSTGLTGSIGLFF